MNKKRGAKGEFHYLVTEVEIIAERFHHCFRLSKAQFEDVVPV